MTGDSNPRDDEFKWKAKMEERFERNDLQFQMLNESIRKLTESIQISGSSKRPKAENKSTYRSGNSRGDLFHFFPLQSISIQKNVYK